MQLNFSQIGFITLVFQLCASLFQPLVGTFTDRRPQPLFVGGWHVHYTCRTCGFVAGKQLRDIAAFCCNDRHRIFDLSPGGFKVAYMAAGNKRGLARSIFR